ncbi:GNAT family N-acetyltransferase [Priestia megaterium]
MDIIWKEVTLKDSEILQSILKVHDKTFPYEVREPHEIFYNSLEYQNSCFPDSFRFLAGFHKNKLCSFATAHYFSKINFGFIVYVVTSPFIRNLGIGSLTLSKIEELLTKDAKAAGFEFLEGIALETEKVEFATTGKEKIDCIKRNFFFEKNNYNHIDEIKYVQPPLRQGDDLIPLNFFIKTNKTKITNQMINDIVKEIFKNKYQKINKLPTNIIKECLDKILITTV